MENCTNWKRTFPATDSWARSRVAAYCSHFSAWRTRLTKPGRPRGSFLFLGPTGVGKTEVTLAFTGFLMSKEHLFRFDMSEYQTQESLGLLLGGKLGERGTLSMVADNSEEIHGWTESKTSDPLLKPSAPPRCNSLVQATTVPTTVGQEHQNPTPWELAMRVGRPNATRVSVSRMRR